MLIDMVEHCSHAGLHIPEECLQLFEQCLTSNVASCQGFVVRQGTALGGIHMLPAISQLTCTCT